MPRLFVIAVLVAGCSYTPVADLHYSTLVIEDL